MTNHDLVPAPWPAPFSLTATRCRRGRPSRRDVELRNLQLVLEAMKEAGAIFGADGRFWVPLAPMEDRLW